MTVAIIDHGSGNLRSAAKAFERQAAELGTGEADAVQHGHVGIGDTDAEHRRQLGSRELVGAQLPVRPRRNLAMPTATQQGGDHQPETQTACHSSRRPQPKYRSKAHNGCEDALKHAASHGKTA